jgi:hypothetical protein
MEYMADRGRALFDKVCVTFFSSIAFAGNCYWRVFPRNALLLWVSSVSYKEWK